MAIYSLNVSSIGKTTHAGGTAGAHIRYISRDSANPEILADHLAPDMKTAAQWFDQFEENSRKNARVADKIRIALPRELTGEQRIELLQSYMQDIGNSRLPWYAAIHQTGKDRLNPHAHVIIHDRDFETNKRHLRLSDSKRDRAKAGLTPNGVDHMRERWEIICNATLEKHGNNSRIDRRSLEDQGIDRKPQIHIGAQAKAIEENVARPESKSITDGRGRVIDYPVIDGGKTRAEYNAEIIDFNLEKAARSSDSSTRIKAHFYKDQRRKDAELERKLIARQRRRVLNYREVRKDHNTRIHTLIKKRKNARQEGLKSLQAEFKPKIEALKESQVKERQSLKREQKKIIGRVLSAIDVSGSVKAAREEKQNQLAERHKTEKARLRTLYETRKSNQDDVVKRTFQKSIDAMNREKFSILDELKQVYAREAVNDDKLRQDREKERNTAEKKIDRTIDLIEQQRKERQKQQSRGFSRSR